jgi:hypothetical protein
VVDNETGTLSSIDAAVPQQPEVASLVAATTIDATRMWRITSDYLLAFFAQHLDGVPAPLLSGPSPAYPEVRFGAP